MNLSESIQVAAAIDKLPPRWKEFKNYLKHKRKEMTMEDLIVRLRIEEDNKNAEKKGVARTIEAKANMVEDSREKQAPSKKRKHPNSNHKGKNKESESKRFRGKCFNCDKIGHKSSECRAKKKGQNQAHVTEMENLSSDVKDLNLSAVVSEVNLVTNAKDWWVDTGATRHICADKDLFVIYDKCKHNEKLFMGNSAISNVAGQGTVILKFTSGKELTLKNVLHVPDIRKNLISGSLLSKSGFKMVFESDKFVLTKGGMFVGKGYLVDGLFKASCAVMDMEGMYLYPQMIINKNEHSSYLLESPNLWHGRLGHANYDALKKMAHLGLIPNFDIEKGHKCEVCVEAKFAKPSFKTVFERTNRHLKIVHSDICDLKYAPSRGGKNIL